MAVTERPTTGRHLFLDGAPKRLLIGGAWVLLRRLRRDWRRHLVVVTAETVLRWHRAGWRLSWRWRYRRPAA